MIELLALSLITSCITTTIILTLKKWGLFLWYEIHRPEGWPTMICQFCLGFWLCAAQATGLYFFYSSEISYIAIPFIGTSIVWKMLNG